MQLRSREIQTAVSRNSDWGLLHGQILRHQLGLRDKLQCCHLNFNMGLEAAIRWNTSLCRDRLVKSLWCTRLPWALLQSITFGLVAQSVTPRTLHPNESTWRNWQNICGCKFSLESCDNALVVKWSVSVLVTLCVLTAYAHVVVHL